MEFSFPDLEDCDYGSLLDLLISEQPTLDNAASTVRMTTSFLDAFQQSIPIHLGLKNPVQSIQIPPTLSDSTGNSTDIRSPSSIEKGSSSSSRLRRRTSHELERNRLYCAEWRIRKKQKDNEIKNHHKVLVKELQDSKNFIKQLKLLESSKDEEIAVLRQRIAQLEHQQIQKIKC